MIILNRILKIIIYESLLKKQRLCMQQQRKTDALMVHVALHVVQKKI